MLKKNPRYDEKEIIDKQARIINELQEKIKNKQYDISLNLKKIQSLKNSNAEKKQKILSIKKELIELNNTLKNNTLKNIIKRIKGEDENE